MDGSGSGEGLEANAAIHRPSWISRNHLSTFMSLCTRDEEFIFRNTDGFRTKCRDKFLESQRVMTELGNRFPRECDRSECRVIR
jgi:hypothetical protein